MVARSIGRDDPAEQLADETVSYWDEDTYIVQNGIGNLIIASDTTVEVKR